MILHDFGMQTQFPAHVSNWKLALSKRDMLRWGGTCTGKGSYIYCIRTKAEKVMGFEYPDVITVALVFVHRMNWWVWNPEIVRKY